MESKGSWPWKVGLTGSLALGLAQPAAWARPALWGQDDAPPTATVQQAAADPSPVALAHGVQAAIQSDPALREHNIGATVSGNGKVTLTGVVSTKAEKDRATGLAEGVKGVSTVDNQLAVTGTRQASPTTTAKQAARETGQEISDSWITTKVKSQLLFTGSGVHVTTSGHVVTLTGTVARQADRAKAVDIAATTDGVISVVDEIRVAPK
jgi:osmotically-inducible protein OsmY